MTYPTIVYEYAGVLFAKLETAKKRAEESNAQRVKDYTTPASKISSWYEYTFRLSGDVVASLVVMDGVTYNITGRFVNEE